MINPTVSSKSGGSPSAVPIRRSEGGTALSVIAATQDTFRAYLSIEVLAGNVLEKVEPVEADVVGIVGIAGARVGYILFAVDQATAELVAILGREIAEARKTA